MSEYYLTKDELYHHGVKGQKWGVRNYQNEDGSYKPGAEGRYNPDSSSGSSRSKMLDAKAKYKSSYKEYSKSYDKAINAGAYARLITKKGRAEQARREDDLYNKANAASRAREEYKQAKKEYKQSDEYKADRKETIKKVAIAGAAVAATALAAYGAYKAHDFIKTKQYNKAISLMKQAKFQDTLHGKYKDIASNYGTSYKKKYDGINGPKKQKYINGQVKLDYDPSKMRKYYSKGESMREGAERLASKSDKQYSRYLGRKVGGDGSSFTAYNALRNRNR